MASAAACFGNAHSAMWSREHFVGGEGKCTQYVEGAFIFFSNAHKSEVGSICFKVLLHTPGDISEKLIETPVSIFVEFKCPIGERWKLLQFLEREKENRKKIWPMTAYIFASDSPC